MSNFGAIESGCLMSLTLKVLSKIIAYDILIFFFFIIFREIRLGISCPADDLHKMLSLIFSEKIQMLAAVVVLSALMVIMSIKILKTVAKSSEDGFL